MRFDVTVNVRGIEGIADPEGRTIERALGVLGFGGASTVRVGKIITLVLDADDANVAEAKVREMCDRLLANPVIERYQISINQAATA